MKFIYCDYMVEYRKRENITNKILGVELVSRSLENKRVKFRITLSTLVCEGTQEERHHDMVVTTQKVGDRFIVPEGWGQLSGGYVEV